MIVLNLIAEHVKDNPPTSSFFSSTIRDKLRSFLETAKDQSCNTEEAIYERSLYGGIEFDPNNPTTYWTEPSQFVGWWKNNVERRSKIQELTAQAQYDGNEARKIQRAKWCAAVVQRINLIKEYSNQTVLRPPHIVSNTTISSHTSNNNDLLFAESNLAAANIESTNGEQSKSFALLLYDLVSDPTEEVIGWNHDGSEFIISDPTKFVDEVMPRIFQSKMMPIIY
jgi:hypothetical protein